MNTISTLRVCHFPVDLAVYVAMYTSLKNACFLRQQLLDGNSEFEYAFLDATSVRLEQLEIFKLLLSILDFVDHTFISSGLQGRERHEERADEVTKCALGDCVLVEPEQQSESFRRFGITDKTTELLVVKLAVSSDGTADTVSRHLSSVIEGTPKPFNDGELRGITDVGKLKKSYKLTVASKNNPRSSTGKKEDADTAENDEYGKRELEVSILGLMALRGVT
ncbi:MAG: hypothetical protein Q9187_005537 [Circinaria calcarea]